MKQELNLCAEIVQKSIKKLKNHRSRSGSRKNLQEIADASSYFEDDFQYDEKGIEKHFRKDGVGKILSEVSHVLQRVEPFEAGKSGMNYMT